MVRIFGRTTPISVLFKTGLREWPEMYAGMVYFGLAMVGTCGLVWYTERHNDQVLRFKKHYMIMRPNDDRVQLYPRLYITDKQYLAKDHPQLPEDLKKCKIDKLHYHADPKLRNPPIDE